MTNNAPAPTARTARILHGGMCAGVILFALVAHFVILPKAEPWTNLASITPLLLALSLGGCVLALFLSTRVPRSASGQSADSFWVTSASPALIAWSFLEGAGLLAIVLYSHTGSRAAISVAGVVIVIFVLLNPAYFERR